MPHLKFPHIACSILLLASPVRAQVITYDFPEEMPTSTIYQAQVAGVAVPALQTQRGAFLNFGMSAPVDIEVTLPKAPGEVVIRPLSAGITPVIDGRILRFTLPRPQNLSVEIDGDLRDPLFIFANPALPTPPDRNDPKVKFFEAGKIHDVGEILVGDGETLYLARLSGLKGVMRLEALILRHLDQKVGTTGFSQFDGGSGACIFGGACSGSLSWS